MKNVDSQRGFLMKFTGSFRPLRIAATMACKGGRKRYYFYTSARKSALMNLRRRSRYFFIVANDPDSCAPPAARPGNRVAHNAALIPTCLRRLGTADKTHMNGEQSRTNITSRMS